MKFKTYQKIADQLKEGIEHDFGKKCKEYEMGCIVCNVWRIVDGVQNIVDWVKLLDESRHIHKHRLKK